LTQTWNLQIGAMTFSAVEVVWIFVPAVFHMMPIIDLLKKSGRWSVVLVSKNLKAFCTRSKHTMGIVASSL
jgi:hypothetical protein